MRGKVGLVIGLGAGYVLGTRAGRERYEQIKKQALKLWNLDPVQDQVDKVKDFAKSSAMALPQAMWEGAVKVTKAASARGSAGEKLDAAIRASKDSVDDVAEAAEDAVAAVKEAAAPKTTTAKKPATAKSSASKAGAAKKAATDRGGN